MPNPRTSNSRTKNVTLIVISIIILVPTIAGFVTKFLEFVHTFRDRSDGVFAITPITNYLLASLGFFCLLVWATFNGMFHDIEQPKHRMLEVEHELDNALPHPMSSAQGEVMHTASELTRNHTQGMRHA